jgi:hypothetical protein
MSRELNKGEALHDLSRFSFGKEGAMRGHEFGDQLHTPSCLSILHNPWWPGIRSRLARLLASYAGTDTRSRTKRSVVSLRFFASTSTRSGDIASTYILYSKTRPENMDVATALWIATSFKSACFWHFSK